MVRDDALRHRVDRASGHGGGGHQPFEKSRLQLVQVFAEHLRAPQESPTIVDPTHFRAGSNMYSGATKRENKETQPPTVVNPTRTVRILVRYVVCAQMEATGGTVTAEESSNQRRVIFSILPH